MDKLEYKLGYKIKPTIYFYICIAMLYVRLYPKLILNKPLYKYSVDGGKWIKLITYKEFEDSNKNNNKDENN